MKDQVVGLKLEKQVTSLKLSIQPGDLGVKRDDKGRFVKGNKPFSPFKKGHLSFIPKLTKEHKENIGKGNKGRISPMKGKTMPEAAKLAIGKANKNKPIYKIRGSNHHNWKGGRAKLQKRIRHLVEYRNWRDSVFKRDNYTCVICEARNGNGKTIRLNADHFPIFFSKILDNSKIETVTDAITCAELWNVDNGRTLCEDCHRQTFIFHSNQYVKGEGK